MQVVNQLLKLAFEKAAQTMSEAEQELFAQWLLAALDRETRSFNYDFAVSSHKLASMAAEVLHELPGGQSESLDIEKLLPLEPAHRHLHASMRSAVFKDRPRKSARFHG